MHSVHCTVHCAAYYIPENGGAVDVRAKYLSCNVHSTVYTVAVYSLHCIIYIAQCTVCTRCNYLRTHYYQECDSEIPFHSIQAL